MYIDRLLYPVHSLGPGDRVVVWTAGCSRRCKNCANPELWTPHAYQRISPQRLAACIGAAAKGSGGLTLTGGEPFDQAAELAQAIRLLSEKPEVLIFTGYSYEELACREEAQQLLLQADVLVDGEYIDVLNDNVSALRGSVNQRIHYLNSYVQEKYEQYCAEGRKIQNFIYDYHILSTGIHNRTLQQRT